jgi:immune inhibitor A
MSRKTDFQLIRNVSSIYQAAARSRDGSRCMVAPHPDLAENLKKQLASLKASNGNLSPLLRLQASNPPGMNDGLIYPGDMFPLGTSARTVRSAAADRGPMTGALRVAVILVQFSDKAMAATKAHFEELFFSLGVLPHGSVREYYREVTHNLVDIVGEVSGPYTLPKTLAQYAHGASGTGGTLPNARTMAYDAAVASNPSINYALYDNDHDGFVDAFIVIHAGPGAEVTGSANDIWSHKWTLPSGAYTADGTTKIYAYLTVPEDSRIGVCCHELGHLLFGFPDLYDTDYSSEGIGNWCLMAGGSWNGGGDVPAHPSAWCKANQGWASVSPVTTNGALSIGDVKDTNTIYRLWKDGAGGNEYFLLENRQKKNYDAGLPGEGLLIWHVDDSIASNTNENHPKVALVQADAKKDLELGHNRGDAGDPYPGSANNNKFDSTTTPNSKSYGGVNTCVSVSSISAPGPIMTANITVHCVIKVKDIKDLKDHTKETRKEIVKETKEFRKEVVKESKEFRKEVEKPITDKTVGFDKGTDKLSDGKLADRPGGGLSPSNWAETVETRLAALESAAGVAPQPFIDSSLRPDLTSSALGNEEDAKATQEQLHRSAAQAKRLFDTGPVR